MYRRLIERGRWLVLLAFLAAAAATGWFLPRIAVDASTSMLLDEKDADLAYYNESRAWWTNDDEFAIVCCRRADWFTPESVEVMKGIEAALAKAPHVSKIESPLTIPLMRSGARNLAAEGVPLARAKAELVAHEIAAGTFVSADGRDATFLPYLAVPAEMPALEAERKAAEASGDAARIRAAVLAHEAGRAQVRERRREFVEAIRAVAAEWRPKLDEPAALSGLPFINLALIEHVTHDLDVFGIASLALFTLSFLVIYRRLRWTALPIMTCLLPVVIVLGAMAALDLKLTVITANLPVLLFVVMLPYTVYFVERYRERRVVFAGESHADSNAGAARDVWLPCLYSCTTTMAGFASLMTSGVKPVWWFGCMMTIGLAAGLACVFLFLPAASAPLGALATPPGAAGSGEPSGVVRVMERSVLRAPGVIVALFAAILATGVWGATKLDVENKFVDYFWPSSEVRRGLTSIDERMGGTTPADIVLTSDKPGFFRTPAGLEAIRAAVKCVEPVPEAGTIWSFASLVDEVRKFLPPATPSAVAGIPAAKPLVRNFVSEDASKARVLVRFQETAPTLKRREILAGLDERLGKEPLLAGLSPRVTGVFKLYANMLDSLLQSQKDTFAMVLGAVWAMVVLAFAGSVPGAAPRPLGGRFVHAAALATIVLLPQALPAVVCLGVMGFAGIPLDLITVTVAAVAMGVGIDAAIQYTVRWRIELEAAHGDRALAVTRTHATVGRSIWLATSIMVAGFVVLALSDFVPTVSFGLFNALAMVAGQVAALTAVPALFLLTGFPRR